MRSTTNINAFIDEVSLDQNSVKISTLNNFTAYYPQPCETNKDFSYKQQFIKHDDVNYLNNKCHTQCKILTCNNVSTFVDSEPLLKLHSCINDTAMYSVLHYFDTVNEIWLIVDDVNDFLDAEIWYDFNGWSYIHVNIRFLMLANKIHYNLSTKKWHIPILSFFLNRNVLPTYYLVYCNIELYIQQPNIDPKKIKLQMDGDYLCSIKRRDGFTMYFHFLSTYILHKKYDTNVTNVENLISLSNNELPAVNAIYVQYSNSKHYLQSAKIVVKNLDMCYKHELPIYEELNDTYKVLSKWLIKDLAGLVMTYLRPKHYLINLMAGNPLMYNSLKQVINCKTNNIELIIKHKKNIPIDVTVDVFIQYTQLLSIASGMICRRF